MSEAETIDQSLRDSHGSGEEGSPIPGVVKIFAGASCLETFALEDGMLTVGRGDKSIISIDDGRVSRNHAEVLLRDGRWLVRDLKSRNGTFLEGQRVDGDAEATERSILSIGGVVLLLCADIRPFEAAGVETRDGVVVGPRLRPVWRAIVEAAGTSSVLHITGDTGSGKELAARLFHDSSERARRSFVAVNCAAIPPAIAERLLFGAKKGAYSGADTSSDGYLIAADGGTLFLDEIAELPLEVQAKLLRAIETREVLPLGAARAQTVNIAICSATHVDLRAHVAAGRFREDLYFRLSSPSVRLPPLRERREDIPWIIEAAIRKVRPTLSAHSSLVESALLRPWPGNVRELMQAMTNAARAARPNERVVLSRHLESHAGTVIGAEKPPKPQPSEPPPKASARSIARPTLTREQLVEALRDSQGNVAAAARSLGLHRTQLRRWMAFYQIDGD
jgi:transcriptional regulator with PAS, ATPase and Fis domain